jgi:hypothetical protein
MISGTGRSGRGTGTLPSRSELVNSSSGGGRGTITMRRRPKKAREETPRIGVATKLVENGTVSNEMIDSATNKAGANRPSIQSCKEKIIISGGRGSRSGSRKRVNQSRAAGEIMG